MRLGCCTRLEQAEIVLAAGFDYLELPVATVRPEEPAAAFATVAAQIRRWPLRPEAFNVFLPPSLPVVGPAVDWVAVQRYVQTATERLADLGAAVLVFGSAGARRRPDDFPPERAWQQLCDFTRLAGDEAGRRGITLVIEPITRRVANTITSVQEALALARAVDHPAVRVLADLYHMAEDDEPLEVILTAGPWLRHVHVPVPDLPILTSTGRVYDHHRFLRLLREAGYTGRISVEDNGRRFRDLGREAPAVAQALRAWWAAF